MAPDYLVHPYYIKDKCQGNLRQFPTLKCD